MRAYLTGLILAGALALGGCAGNSAVTGGTGALVTGPSINVPAISVAVPQNVADLAAQVQAYAVKGCQFEPFAETVIALIGTFTNVGAVVPSAVSIARNICSAVVSKGARRGGRPPVLRGVPIRGRRV